MDTERLRSPFPLLKLSIGEKDIAELDAQGIVAASLRIKQPTVFEHAELLDLVQGLDKIELALSKIYIVQSKVIARLVVYRVSDDDIFSYQNIWDSEKVEEQFADFSMPLVLHLFEDVVRQVLVKPAEKKESSLDPSIASASDSA